MKKSVSALAVAAVLGLSAMTAAPANATTISFKNCTEAEAAGYVNIPAGAPGYAPHLDGNSDGVACERGGSGNGTTNVAPAPAPAPVVDNQVPAQVAQMPVGGVATGAAQETHDNSGLLALGGLAAAAVAGSLIVRRRASVRA